MRQVVEVQRDEILARMRRITGDFEPLLHGIRLEVVPPEGFGARVRGRPILPGVSEPVEETPAIPVRGLPASRTIVVEIEGLMEIIGRENQRLHRPLVEGMILREIIYLATSRQPLPQPRARAETILRRHWPFQYVALHSVEMAESGPRS